MTIEELVYRFRVPITLLLVGITLAAVGVFLTADNSEPEFEIVSNSEVKGESAADLIVEVSGAVINPGVYKLTHASRVEDAITSAGGLSEDANTDWVAKYLNRAAFVTDGQKIYVPNQSEEQSDSNSEVVPESTGNLVNINTATKGQLEELYGIGPVYAQKIIDNRPYSDVNELLVKKVVTQKIYDENQKLLTVY